MRAAVGYKIIGAGVSGLTVGIEFLENGCKEVELISYDFHPNINSSVAAAVWVPYKVEPVSRAKEWCAVSFRKFQELARDDSTGVSWINCTQVYKKEDVTIDWMSLTRQVESPKYLSESYKTVVTNRIPLIDTTFYMEWLMKKFISLGGKVTHKKVKHLSELCQPETIIVNCSGLGSRELASDESLSSVSGQILTARLPQGLESAIGYDENPEELTYVVPRRKSQTVIIGGTAIENDEDSHPDEILAKKIWARAIKLCPQLAKVDRSTVKHVKGFRPVRPSVRVELEMIHGTPVIHNYGHGGGGFAISWGCAKETRTICTINNL